MESEIVIMNCSKHKKPRLLFINYSLGIGGIETLLLELCRYLVRDESIEPAICIFEGQGHIEEEFKSLGVPVYELPKRDGWDLSLAWRVRKLIREHRFDLVHAHNQAAWLYGGLGAWMSGCKLIYSEHSPLSKFSVSSQKRLRPVFRQLARKTILVTTVANHLVEDLVIHAGVPREKIRVIYNGIEMSLFRVKLDREQMLEELGLPAGSQIIGILASLTEAKDHATLLLAFRQVVREIPQAVLLVCGSGPLESALRQQVVSLGLENNVRFLGVRRDVAMLLQLFDVFSLSSVREGLPISILEAMAAGCPVVATNIPGNAELVEHGRYGLLVAPRDPEQLAAALIRLLSDPGLARTLGERGRQRVAREFRFTTMIQHYVSLYNQVLDSPPGEMAKNA